MGEEITNQVRRVTIRGNVGGFAGYHFHLNEVVTWLSRMGVYVNVRPIAISEDFGSKIPLEVKSRFVQRSQPEPWEVVIHPPGNVLTPGKKTLFWTMWESTRLNQPGFDALSKASAIVVCSAWNASCFTAQGLDKPIFVVPLGVDPDVFNFSPMPSGVCIFGGAGRLAHGGSRKGLYEVIDAFQAAFPGVKDVRLKVKCFTDCNVQKPDDPRIEILTDFLSDSGLANWLRGLTCFVSASRAEGWGLFQHQSMACGRPVIGCHYGGMAEFMNIHNSYGVAYTHEKATGFYEGCGTWSEPSPEDLVRQMQFVYHNREDAVRKGMQAHLDVRHLTWENSAKRLVAVLEKLGAL